MSSDRIALYQAFWQQWRERLNAAHPGWSKSQNAPKGTFFQFTSGVAGVNIIQSFTRRGLAVQFQFEGPDAGQNLARYQVLEARKAALEAAYAGDLIWEPLPDNKVARVAVYDEHGIITDQESWPAYLSWFLDQTERIKHAVESTGGVPAQ